MKAKHHAKRMPRGRYLYRGQTIYSLGYYQPERRVVWEAIDENGDACAHGYTLREVKYWIDFDLDGG